MRTRGGLDSDYVNSSQWNDRVVRGQRYSSLEFEKVDGVLTPRVNSISGHERNKLFINHDGLDFEDVSLWSGGDSIADGRCFATWDYDHDGGQDLALINMNSPHLQILHNQIPDRGERPNGFIAIRLIGGNDQPRPSSQWSNRNGIGAQVVVAVDDRSFLHELRCGEGFSSQNSNTVIVGIGDNQSADQVTVKWPSGKSSRCGPVPSGSLVSFHENVQQAVAGSPVIEGYQSSRKDGVSPSPKEPDAIFDYAVPAMQTDTADLRIMVTMATWCESCRKHLAAIGRLRKKTDRLNVSWYGVPIDGADSSAELKDYARKYAVPYVMLDDLEPRQRQQAVHWIRHELGTDALPSTIVTDRYGHPLHVQSGIPTVSDIVRFHDLVGHRETRK